MNQDKIKDLVDNFPAEKLQSDEIELFIQQMRKRLIEQALQGEMDAYLGYDCYKVALVPIATMTPVKRY